MSRLQTVHCLMLDDEDTLAEYFGTNLPIETVKGLLRQEFKEEFEEELDP